MEELITDLIQKGVLRDQRIIDAFINISRKNFVLPEDREEACEKDYPLSIGFGQTISEPLTVAFMIELLEPKEEDKILDVGSGSGWTTALLAELANKGFVYGTEIVPELVEFGRNNMARYKFKNAEILQAGENIGLEEKAPFDKILVSASVRVLPEDLIKQLKIGGVMIIPLGNCILKLKRLTEKKIEMERFDGFAFAPLK
jgi:protein-L-isoaspartate(D-aspartate) O-methyltransferase